MADDAPPRAEVLHVAVVGAGLSGLATAIAAALSGHRVTVFEAAKELLEVGAGLQVTPNATRILQRWDLPGELWRAAAEPAALVVHRYNGEVLAREGRFGAGVRARYGGAPFADLHRVDLQRALHRRARDLGVAFRLGERVVSVDDGGSGRDGGSSDDDDDDEKKEGCGGAGAGAGGAEVACASGLRARADLVVAADGLWSACRDLFPRPGGVGPDPPRPTGDLAYRIVLGVEDLSGGEEDDDDDELQLLRSRVQNPECHFWIGPGAHAVAYSLRGGAAYNIVLLAPDDLPAGARRQAGSVEEMRARFASWDPVLCRFLGKVREVEKWRLMHRDEMASWVNEKGNFVFVGDACHPMLPYLAQGANSAIEDGAVLGALLGHIKSRDQLPKALKMYESLRKERGERIVKETFKQRDDFHMPDGPEQEARDELFRSQLGGQVRAPFPSRWTCPEVQPWLYGYDAYAEVEAAVAKDPF